VAFSRRLDALFDLLDITADALAAMWDERKQGMGRDRLGMTFAQ
jgi:hypothetical protein